MNDAIDADFAALSEPSTVEDGCACRNKDFIFNIAANNVRVRANQAVNVRSPAEVDALLERVARYGAKVTKKGQPTDWGGYSGYFTDLDGFLWEVAHNPSFPHV